ncbi:hypothetical protein LZ31DRAFT_559950 [Colletotrichum somersetense]|nr:hypothetical protein LZ31DRAFT_559950 [Colletotrichum somersetense]
MRHPMRFVCLFGPLYRWVGAIGLAGYVQLHDHQKAVPITHHNYAAYVLRRLVITVVLFHPHRAEGWAGSVKGDVKSIRSLSRAFWCRWEATVPSSPPGLHA